MRSCKSWSLLVSVVWTLGYLETASGENTHLIKGDCGQILTTLDEHSLVSFKSPHYPNASSGDLNCELKLLLPHGKDVVVRIDFIDFETDGPKYGRGAKDCDSDMFFLKGFNGWTPPPRCGYLTGYSTFVDTQDPRASDMKILTLLALMSTSEYLWNIQISLIKSNVQIDAEKKSSNADSDPNEEHNSKAPRNLKAKAIYHGKNTTIDQIPWQVSIRKSYQSLEASHGTEYMRTYFEKSKCDYHEHIHFCGGSIVHEKYILTAAHCFFAQFKSSQSKSPSETVIVIGDTARCDPDVHSKSYEVEQIIFHYAYDQSTYEDDIVLLKLKTEIEIDGIAAKIIELAPEENEYYEGRNATASGWGRMSRDSKDVPNILQSNDHFVIHNSTACAHFYTHIWLLTSPSELSMNPKYSQLGSTQICTGEIQWEEKSSENETSTEPETFAHVGQGDSGGPLIVLDGTPSEPVLVGITSFGLSSQSGTKHLKIDYFTSVPFFRHWISSVINQ